MLVLRHHSRSNRFRPMLSYRLLTQKDDPNGRPLYRYDNDLDWIIMHAFLRKMDKAIIGLR